MMFLVIIFSVADFVVADSSSLSPAHHIINAAPCRRKNYKINIAQGL